MPGNFKLPTPRKNPVVWREKTAEVHAIESESLTVLRAGGSFPYYRKGIRLKTGPRPARENLSRRPLSPDSIAHLPVAKQQERR